MAFIVSDGSRIDQCLVVSRFPDAIFGLNHDRGPKMTARFSS